MFRGSEGQSVEETANPFKEFRFFRLNLIEDFEGLHAIGGIFVIGGRTFWLLSAKREPLLFGSGCFGIGLLFYFLSRSRRDRFLVLGFAIYTVAGSLTRFDGFPTEAGKPWLLRGLRGRGG